MRVGAACALLGLACLPVQAHRSYAMFDMQRELTIEGTVKDFQWTNPHIWIDLVVIDANGKAVNWSVEGKGPVELVKDGWRFDAIKAGDRVSLLIHPLKRGTAGGSLVKAQVNGMPVGQGGKGG